MKRGFLRADRSGGSGVEDDVERFLEGLPAAVSDIVVALRLVVRGIIPQAEESVVWGSLSYHRPDVGGRVKGGVCLIVVRKGQVRLDFIHGVRLPDPRGLLRGSLVAKRFVPITTREDALHPEIADLIRAAANFDPAQGAGPAEASLRNQKTS
jgi:hypothetical protein